MGEGPSPKGVFGSIFDFLKVLGASLTGITAILTAAGFLAERSRLAMLGLPSATFDLEQYVETGALLLALLPVVMGIAILLILVSWMKAIAAGGLGYAVIVLLAGIIAAVVYLRVRRRSGDQPSGSARSDWKRRLAGDHLSRRRRYAFGIVLTLALAFQIASVAREVAVLETRDVLFAIEADRVSASADAQAGAPDEITATLTDVRGDGTRSVRLFGEIVLLAAINASIIYYVIRKRLPTARSRGRRWMLTGWTVVSILLLVSQVTLLPVSYGVLISRNTYPEVCATLTNEEPATGEPLPDSRLSLVHQRGEGFYFYSRERRKMWYVPRGAVQSLVHHARTNILEQGDPEPCYTEEQP